MKPKTQRQAIIWGRFSSDKQSDGDSRTRQDKFNHACAIRKGITVIAEHFDEGTSVKDAATPLFKRVLAELPKHVGIICENLDRINRGHPWRAKAYIADILEAGHFIITSQDDREYNSDTIEDLDTMVLGDMATNVARYENNKRKVRLRAAKNAIIELARQGKPAPLGPWLPSHVTYHKGGDEYIVNEARKAVINRIYQEYLAGKGCGNIARGLNQDGVPTFRTKKRKVYWIGGVISQILRAECYIGTLIFNGERIPNAYPPAVSESVFYKVQGMFKANKARHGNYASENINNILRGVSHCDVCGNSMRLYMGYNDTLRIQCGGYRVGKCNQKNMAQYPDIEFAFAKWLIPQAKDALLGKDSTHTLVETLETKRSELEKRIGQTIALLDEGLAVNEVKSRLTRLESERAQLEIELTEARAKLSHSVAHPDTLKQLEKYLNGIKKNQEIRRKVAALIPTLVEDVRFDLEQKNLPAFTIQFVNGTVVNAMYVATAKSLVTIEINSETGFAEVERL